VVDALRAAHRRGATVMSICTGAFILAAAGLLDGRPATTHWAYCDDLARAYPTVRVDPAALYVDDGDVLTSAGLCAGMDMCLHYVRRETGAAAAASLARWNVTPPHRDGGQAQYAPSRHAFRDGSALAETLAWATENLRDAVDVAALARHAHLSERTLIRRFRTELATTPKRWLDAQRITRAREMLEETNLPIAAVAEQCGFGSVTALRAHLRAAAATTPSAYRSTFHVGER
jgi:transcriptional regulator GlxA family with amidase domain